MRRQLVTAASVALLLVAMTVAGAAPILDGSKITQTQLDNGLRLIVKPEHQWGLVSVGLYIRAGSFCESDDNAGVAHLLEHLLFEATDRTGTQRIATAIEGMGGTIGARTTRDFTHVDVTVASQFLPEALELMATAAFELELTPATVAREREIVARELTDRATYAEGSLDDLIWATAFSTHPYRRGIGGDVDQVARLTIEQIEEFHTRFYVPANMTLIVVGDVEPDDLTASVDELFGAQPAAAIELPVPPAEMPQSDIRTVVRTRASDTTLFTYAWRAPGIADPVDVCAMDLIYTLLGEGAFGRLYPALEETGLALMTSVDYLTQRYPGLVMITVLTTPEHDLRARGSVLAEVARLRDDPVPEIEIAQAKRLLRISYAFNNEAYSDQVATMGFYAAIDSYQFAVDYLDLTDAVTAEDITRVARKYLTLDNYTLTVIRPKPGGTEEARAICDNMPPLG